jgi:hypothetical protein
MRTSLLSFALFLVLGARDVRAEDAIVTVVSAKDVKGARAASAAVGANGDVLVVFGADDKIQIASSRDAGKTFEPPRVVASSPVFALGFRRGPRIAATASGACVAAIGGEKGAGKDGDVLAWVSSDACRSFSKTIRVNDEAGSAREGLFALAAGPDDALCCVWLDLRNKKTEVWCATSSNGGNKWSANSLVYRAPGGSICECCAPTVSFDADGNLHAMWRNQIDGARDLWFCTSTDRGKTFGEAKKLGTGTWKVPGCPMDGGSLCGGANGAIDSVWRRDRHVFLSHGSSDETRLGAGQQPTIARGGGGSYVAWIETRGGALRLLEPGRAEPREIAPAAIDPTLFARFDASGPVHLVWESETGIFFMKMPSPAK